MKRSRSALARHRKQKLLEATQHASAAPELRLVSELALATEPASLLEDVVSDWDHHHTSQSGDAVVSIVQVLRNVNNSVYHRAMAARALGLLMHRDPSLVARLRLESEDLLDALLQLINCCRRFQTHSNDTRRVHVNCCLVISMLTRAPGAQAQQLVVSLESELLAMPARPTDPSSGFLLLTVSGRPESSSSTDVSFAVGGVSVQPAMQAKGRAPLRPLSSVPSPPQRHGDKPGPSTMAKKKARAGAQDKLHHLVEDADEEQRLAPVINRRQTPSREFKMDRYRVVTPVMVPSSVQGPRSTPKTPLPVIPQSHTSPSPPGSNQNSSPRAIDGASGPPPASASLVPSQHMVEILRTGKMPIAAADYHSNRLRDEIDTAGSTSTNRLAVVEWGEWRRRGLGESQNSNDDNSGVTPVLPLSPLTTRGQQRQSQPPPVPTPDIHTPEYKRERLREILSSPADASIESMTHLQELDARDSSTTLAVLTAERAEVQAAEQRSRLAMRTRIEAQRDQLPLKFLFTLPGGAAYCRHRMRRALELWIHEFEVNQQRLALLQWKTVVEQLRYKERGHVYHRLALEKRLRAAIEFVLRGYQRQAIAAWVVATQTAIWHGRDAAARKIQRQVRRHRALLTFLQRHHAHPFGGPYLCDVWLAPPRHGLPFAIPSIVRDQRRCLWFAAETLQRAIRYRRFRRFLLQYRIAATKIQARARMRIARHQYREQRRRIILLQAWVRGHRDYVAYHALRNAAVLVQTAFRGVRMRRLRRLVLQTQRREAERRLSAALLIQRMARGLFAKREAQRRRDECAARWHAALVVQRAWYRRNNEWSTFLLLGCLREQEAEETQLAKRLNAITRRSRARQIQRVWATYRFHKRTQAASFVQRNVRRWLATRRVRRLRLEKMARRRLKWFLRFRHAHRVKTATRLQFWWLRAVPGRLARHLRTRRRIAEAQARARAYLCHYDAAVGIQRVVRGRQGRVVAKRERCARVIQRAIREFLFWRRVQRELRRIKRVVAVSQSQEYISIGSQRVLEAKMCRLHAAVTRIQRRMRGVLTRMQLTRSLVMNERRDAMARRLQHRWRQSAQHRVAQRVLVAQRRRRENPFIESGSISDVIDATMKRAMALYDPQDELQGVHVAAWLRRLGLNEEKYTGLFKGPSDVAKLRQLSMDACREKLEAMGIDDDEHVRHLATHLLARRTIEDAKKRRRELGILRSLQQRDTQREATAALVLRRTKQQVEKLQEQLEQVLQDASEFRNPPKALRDERERVAQRLVEVEREVKEAQGQHQAIVKRLEQRQRTIALRQVELVDVETDEVSASYSVASFRLLTGRPHVARELFLAKFPGLEARALAFAGAVGESVSTWQLVRFFQANATVAAVKLAMPTLTYCAFESEITRHDHARLGQCCDVLQYGCERIGDLLGLSVESMVLGHEGKTSEGDWLRSMVIDAMATLRTGRAVRDRADGWLAWVSMLQEMNAVATRVQSHWRRRAAVHMTAAMKAAQWQQRMKDAYVTEVNADYVTPLWRKEREREQRELEEWEQEEALRLREEALQQILRYPWRDVWDDDAQRYGVCREDPVLGWEWLLDDEPRPVYSVDEEDAAIVIQSAARRWLARQELRRRQRLRRRQIRQEALEKQWQRVAHEREQSVTLRLSLRISADADVSVWLGRRGRPPPKETSPKRRRQAVDQQEEEKKRVAAVASVDRIDARLEAVTPQCVETYNASVRAAHRRNMTFPAAARPPNAHARAILAQVDATQRLHRTLAPQVTTGTSLPFTRAALPFGWRQEGDYFYHAQSGESSWDRPQYTFMHEHAATMIQSVARMMLAQAARQRMLESISLVEASHNAVAAAARIGWIGVGTEGITPRVLMSRLGIARQTIDATPFSVEALLRPPAEPKLLQLGWTKEEASVLAVSASVLRPLRRKRPLTSYALPLNPATKHPFNVLPSERVLQQIVAQSLPNQQGRVATLVNAVLQSNTPIAYRQLEMHLRRFAGRPDDAAARIHEIASLPFATQPPQEQTILSELLRGLERCLVTAAVLRLTALHGELSAVARVAAALLDDHLDTQSKEDDSLLYTTHVIRSPATPLAKRPQASTMATSIAQARAWCLASSPKGLWEPRPDTSDAPLSFAQVARFVRLRGLERALEWWRSAALVQSVFRMHRTRVWYTLTMTWRNASCTKLQSAWRGFIARELRRLLEAQRRSVYETRRDALTQKFYIIHVPTGEKLLDEPRDAFGVLLPVRPMVQDRVTKRWVRAWPLDTNQPSRDQRPKDDSDSWTVPCSMCKVERGVRRCLECVAPTGDYVDYCLACFFDTHDDSSSHTFTLLHAATRVAFHCVECQRFSSRRCLACDEHYCARCFARVHRRGHRRVGHQCEHYAARAKVCAECEQRVAMQHCQACGDSLCESCATATHARGAKRSHTLVLLTQPLEDGEVYCEQCKARRGERGACTFCHATLCAVCLVDEGKHAVECVETRLALAVRALVGDRRCVECGKRADRKCQTCGDLYCSVRWMGNAGCFERFHWKGRRADHAYAPLPVEDEEQESEKRRKMEEEIKALEEQVRVKRREDAMRAEQEASELAAALRRAAEQEADMQAEMTKKKKTASKKRRNKTRRASQQKPGACRVDGCMTMTLSAAVPFCAKHLTSQHALEVAQQDPLEAAKLLAMVEQNGGKLPVPTGVWSRLRLRFQSPKKPAPSPGDSKESPKDGTKKTKTKNKT